MEIIEITKDNYDEYKPSCFLNPKTEAYKTKKDWILKQLKNGLKVKILFDESDKKIHGYIEYIDGEKAWRAVTAKNYLFIHCMWIYPNKYKLKGYGTQLINEAIKDSKGKYGVATIASDGPFMHTKDIFLKNKFKLVEENGKDQLLVKENKKGALPKLNDSKKQLEKLKGWHILYSKQCPWIARFVEELDPKIIKDLNIKIQEIKTAKDAQNAPSIYSGLNIVKDGKMLADRYISNTRFKNIIKKETK